MSQDKDELARLLGEMAEGEHAEDEHAAHADHDDHVGHVSEQAPPPAAPAPPPKPTPPAPVAKSPPPTPPRPAVKPAPPKPIAPVAKAPAPPPQAATPPRPAVKPALPPRPAPVSSPQPPPPTPKPLFTPPAQATALPTPIPEPLSAPPAAASAPIIADEEEPDRYSGTDDDAVIVPAVAPTELARPRPHVPRRQHLSQKLFFKQTIIPILLTLAAICIIIPVLGLISSPYSPFKTLAETYFMATFWPLGLAFLVFGVLTMLSVKKELEHTAQNP